MTTAHERFLRTMHFEQADRVPLVEWGAVSETVERWMGESGKSREARNRSASEGVPHIAGQAKTADSRILTSRAIVGPNSGYTLSRPKGTTGSGKILDSCAQ